MKYFACSFFIHFILFSNVVSAGLISWSSQSFSPLPYFSRAESGNYNIEDCGDGIYQFQLTDAKITPEFLVPGTEVTLEINGILSEEVIRKDYGVCSANGNDSLDIQCPIEKGALKIIQKINVPKDIPMGVFTVRVEAYNGNDYDLACIKADINFAKRPNQFLQLVGSRY